MFDVATHNRISTMLFRLRLRLEMEAAILDVHAKDPGRRCSVDRIISECLLNRCHRIARFQQAFDIPTGDKQ